ncbi:MAG: FoF1 ATP synthase subunit a [Candidatus Hydrogenedentes bacterium]|nr:FoF1 ATP synthase subunit a [Candidatus Hydrogenedentota bacterium]
MESIGERLIWHYVPFTNIALPLGGVNVLTVFNTLVVIFVLLTLMRLAIRRMEKIPGRGQVLVEMFVSAFDDLVAGSLELETRRENRKYFPLIAALFCFLLLSNVMGFLPGDIFQEPTADINTTLSLGIIGMVITTFSGMRAKGALGYFEELLGPMWSEEGAEGMARIAGKLSALLFFPLNVVGEVSKVISISFRLFGNIMGGAIIIIVVSTLTYNVLLPIGLSYFFGFFVGTIQAFVFTMLTLTYIAVAIK